MAQNDTGAFLPPPYSPHAESSMTASSPSLSQNESRLSRVPHVRLPRAWSLYRPKTLSDGQALWLGEHEADPFCAVSQHPGWSGEPEIILHNGTSTSAPPLAAGWRSGATRPTVHSQISILPTVMIPGNAQILLRREGIIRPAWRFEFGIECIGSSSPRMGTFEWRHGSLNGIEGFETTASGYKLIRLKPSTESGSSGNASGQVRSSSSRGTSTNCEVVAVWAQPSAPMSEVLKFKYLGMGESGDLGEAWELAAAMTALRMYQKSIRDK